METGTLTVIEGIVAVVGSTLPVGHVYLYGLSGSPWQLAGSSNNNAPMSYSPSESEEEAGVGGVVVLVSVVEAGTKNATPICLGSNPSTSVDIEVSGVTKVL